jgi:ribosomal protein S18 acetylase RimI-like enzyme
MRNLNGKKLVNNWDVKLAKREDVDRFVKGYIFAYKDLEDYKYSTRREVKNYFKWLLKRDPDGVFILEENGRLIGVVACDSKWIAEEESVLEIHELFVLPEYRGTGAGEKLLDIALKYAKKKGLKKAMLWVGKGNKRAIKFYKKEGFKIVGEQGKWLRMEKSLDY